uniref:calmodulin-regulated spectrin-associated protein 1 isoform X2 n=1 Tax=Myxine glutinosa TaxID=7769 RepID=UPI00358F5C5E
MAETASRGTDEMWELERAGEFQHVTDPGSGGDVGTDSDVPEIVLPELYDSSRAKVAASLAWLFGKFYGSVDNIPADLRDPFYTDQYEQEHIKPPILHLLLSAHPYVQVCKLVCGQRGAIGVEEDDSADPTPPPQAGHRWVLESLSRKGLFVMDEQDRAVNEADLRQTPIQMASHLALMDGLMLAYAVHIMSTERVVATVTRFASFSASSELPYDLEDAMLFWINKVNQKMREIVEKEWRFRAHLPGSSSPHKVRYRREASFQGLPCFPVLESLVQDLSDGAALTTLIHYYCPDYLPLQVLCLREVLSLADSLHNLGLLREFCDTHLQACCTLTREDILYGSSHLKNNLMAFVAELFWWFELVQPELVKPRDVPNTPPEVRSSPVGPPRLPIAISNATKRSFLNGASRKGCGSNPDISQGKGNPSNHPHPLLPLRQKQQQQRQTDVQQSTQNTVPLFRSNSLTRVDGSPKGWPDRKQRPASQPVQIDSCFGPISDGDQEQMAFTRSLSKDSLAAPTSPRQSVSPPSSHKLLSNFFLEPDDEDPELVAIAARRPLACRRHPEVLSAAPMPKQPEPLIPAILRPAKEKWNVECKEVEMGEENGRPGGGWRKKERERSRVVKQQVEQRMQPPDIQKMVAVRTDTRGRSTQFSPSAAHCLDRNQDVRSGFFLHPSPTRPNASLEIGMKNERFNGLGYDSKDRGCYENHLDGDDYVNFVGDAPLSDTAESIKLQAELRGKDRRNNKDQIVALGIIEVESDGPQGIPAGPPSSASSPSGPSCGLTRITSFAERRGRREGSTQPRSGSSSSQRTTPDGSESCGGGWGQPARATSTDRRLDESDEWPNSDGHLAAEMLQLRMKLEERRRAIESQKRQMETLYTQRRQKLGKEAFLDVVRRKRPGKNGEETKQDGWEMQQGKVVKATQRRDTGEKGGSVEKLKILEEEESQKLQLEEKPETDDREKDVMIEEESDAVPATDDDEENESEDIIEAGEVALETERDLRDSLAAMRRRWLDGNENDETTTGTATLGGLPQEPMTLDSTLDCGRSIDRLNDTLNLLRDEMERLSQQQETLLKMKTEKSVAPSATSRRHSLGPDSTTKGSVTQARRRAGRPLRGRPQDLRISQDSTGLQQPQASPQANSNATSQRMTPSPRLISPPQDVDSLPHLRRVAVAPTVRTDALTQSPGSQLVQLDLEGNIRPARTENVRRQSREWKQQVAADDCEGQRQHCWDEECHTGEIIIEEEADQSAEISEGKGRGLIEVDLSGLESGGKVAEESVASENVEEIEGHSGMGFFFKDQQKAEGEMARRRAAFLEKQHRKAEEARQRRAQQEAEVEQKREETRRKAEEERLRKEDERARKELIKQEYLRRKQQQLLDEQPSSRPRPKPRPHPRPKSSRRDHSSDSPYRAISVSSLGVSRAESGSVTSIGTEGTMDTDSTNSSHKLGSRTDSMECLSVTGRVGSRQLEKDWENGSTTSSINSVAEYTGPKLYKEPSAKSNKHIICNAICHCCLAGKVNEPQKNKIIEELERCDANHFVILFRDAGCQFRGVYTFSPDTETMGRLIGVGPRSITSRMVDRLYKYNSDRKQFSFIPAKTMSVSVDALTIQGHCWQARRPLLSRKFSGGPTKA